MSEYLTSAVFIFLFILLGGVFAASELALVSLRESQLVAIEQRGWRGRTVAKLAREPNTFLGAVQIGVTVSGFTSAAFGATALSPLLSPSLVALGLDANTASAIAVITLTLAIAYLSLVFGELAPKRLALQRAVGFSMIMAPIIAVIAVLFKPIIWIVGKSSDLVVVLLGGDPKKRADELSAEELITIVESHQGLSSQHREMLSDVLASAEHTIDTVMKPRSDVVTLDGSMTVAQAREFVARHPYSRYPIVTRELDDCISFVHVRDLLTSSESSKSVSKLGRPIPMLPSITGVLPAISNLRSGGSHIALVVDEYGGTDGLVTLEDLIEELVGEVYDEHDTPERIKSVQKDGSWRVSGLTPMRKVSELVGTEIGAPAVVTVAGLIMNKLGRLAKAGDQVEVEGFVFSALEVSGRRILTVEISIAQDEN